MIKSFKKGLALVLAAAMVFSTPIAVNPTKADAAQTLTSAAWWSGTGNSQNYTMSGKKASFEFGIKADELVDGYGAFSVELFTTLGQDEDGKDLKGYITSGSDGNCWFAEKFVNQGTIEGTRDPLASNLTAGTMYTVKVTRDDHKFDIEYIDANTEETKDHFTATLNDDVTIPDDVTIHFMAQVGTYTVTPFAVPVNKKAIKGIGWWNAENTKSDVYYVEPNSSTDIYVANTDGGNGLILETATAEGFITANLQGTNATLGALDVWGEALDNSLNFIKPAEGTTYNFPAKGIIKVSIAREGQKLTVTLTDAATDTVVASGEATLKCPETENLGFYIGAQDGSFDVGPTLGSVASLISDLKAAVSKDGTKIQLTAQKDRDFDDIYVNVNDEKDELNDVNVASNGAISYEYAPEESGDYKFDMVAEKAGFAKDVESASLGVVVEDGKIVLDAELASDFAVVKGGASYGFTAKKLFDDVTYTIEVSESGKVVATLKEGETLDFSKLTSGKEYTAKLIAKKDGYATKTYTAEKFKYEAAAKATTPTNFANITTQPVVKYTFDNADGLTLNGDAKVVDGVLNLANTTTQHNNSWAKIADITKYDFSKGMTITSDVKVTSWVGDWSKIILLGNIKGFKKFSEMAEGDVAYGITEGFMSCIDVDKGIKTGYYGGGQAVTAGTAKEGAAPLGTTAMPLVYNWYADTTKQNRWDTITVTITPTEMITYYDGVKVQSYKDDYTVILNAMKKASENYLGTSYFSDDFDFAGALDNVGIYDTALSADEVSKLSEAKADNTAAKPTEQGSQQATAAKNKSLFFTDWSAAYGKKKVTGELNTSGATVTVKVGKKAAVKATVKGKTFTAKVAKLTKGTKVVITAKKDGYSTATKTITVKAPMKVKSVKAKKGTKKVTGTISVKGATVKVKVGKKAYKKAKVKGKKFTLKVAKLKKGTKVKVQATKKNYKTATKTVKVK